MPLFIRKVATSLSDVKEAIESLSDSSGFDEICDLADNNPNLRENISNYAHSLVELIAEAEANFEDEQNIEDEDDDQDEDEE